METLDLTDKINWDIKNTQLIAYLFRYTAGKPFEAALNSFITETVTPATSTALLASVAVAHFREWRPSLPHSTSADSLSY